MYVCISMLHISNNVWLANVFGTLHRTVLVVLGHLKF
jgi:hypothetical protein